MIEWKVWSFRLATHSLQLLQCTFRQWTEDTLGTAFLGLTNITEPGSLGNLFNSIACLQVNNIHSCGTPTTTPHSITPITYTSHSVTYTSHSNTPTWWTQMLQPSQNTISFVSSLSYCRERIYCVSHFTHHSSSSSACCYRVSIPTSLHTSHPLNSSISIFKSSLVVIA